MSRRRYLPVAILLVVIALLPTLLSPTRAHGAEITRDFTFAAGNLDLVNLIGAVEVRQGEGNQFRVTVNLRGNDMTADLVKLEQDAGSLNIRFPLEQHSTYVYPALGRNSSTTTILHEKDDKERSWLRRTFGMLAGKRVTVRGKGSGMEAWADVTIEVPAGSTLTVRNTVGDVSAADLKADLDLQTSVGGMSVQKLGGNLTLDTGSGNVKVSEITGDLDVDTGSGDVEMSDCSGKTAKLDTGSGHVEVNGLRVTTLSIDTGSGSVVARGLEADEGKIDTGSGDVEMQMDRIGAGRFVLDTGSGAVDLVLPSDASVQVTADTGSGDVDSKFPGKSFEKLDDGRHRLTLGDGAAEVRMDTGSGSVTVSRK